MEAKTLIYREPNEPLGQADTVDELAWAMFDDRATEEQVKRLEEMIVSSEDAKRRYLKCATIEADLFALFADERASRPSRLDKKSAA